MEDRILHRASSPPSLFLLFLIEPHNHNHNHFHFHRSYTGMCIMSFVCLVVVVSCCVGRCCHRCTASIAAAAIGASASVGSLPPLPRTCRRRRRRCFDGLCLPLRLRRLLCFDNFLSPPPSLPPLSSLCLPFCLRCGRHPCFDGCCLPFRCGRHWCYNCL